MALSVACVVRISKGKPKNQTKPFNPKHDSKSFLVKVLIMVLWPRHFARGEKDRFSSPYGFWCKSAGLTSYDEASRRMGSKWIRASVEVRADLQTAVSTGIKRLFLGLGSQLAKRGELTR